MRKVIFSLLLFFLVTSCEEKVPPPTTDPALYGKWWVDYSKQESYGKFSEDGVFIASSISHTIEYFGDYDSVYAHRSEAGLFQPNEYQIEFNEKNELLVYNASYDRIHVFTTYYEIREDGYMYWKYDKSYPEENFGLKIHYEVEGGNKLTLEIINHMNNAYRHHTISKYHKME